MCTFFLRMIRLILCKRNENIGYVRDYSIVTIHHLSDSAVFAFKKKSYSKRQVHIICIFYTLTHVNGENRFYVINIVAPRTLRLFASSAHNIL